MKKIAAVLGITFLSVCLFFSSAGFSKVDLPLSGTSSVDASMLSAVPLRLAGASRFDTAIQVSQAGWEQAQAVVLARGDNYPDALAGAVLAQSAKVKGPLLLTEPRQLSAGVLAEIQRLKAKKVYVLGGKSAVSAAVEETLRAQGLEVVRLQGGDRYETAAKIARESVPSATQAYLASGNSFADALSISSYAAAKGVPLLLTDKGSVPEVTLSALQALGVKNITLVGGDGVVAPQVAAQLTKLNFAVDRLAGSDRYDTNVKVLQALGFDNTQVYVATGEDFPDALAGAALAAAQNSPIALVPTAELVQDTKGYLDLRRLGGSHFTMLGGWGVISYGIETMIRSGAVAPRISLQYLQAYDRANVSAYTTYLKELSLIPGKATDAVDFVAPHWFQLNLIPEGQSKADGSFSGPWPNTTNNYTQIVAAAHARGLKVLPDLYADWDEAGKAAVDSVLKNPEARQNLISGIVTMLKQTGADGVVIDLEYLSDDSGPALTLFMKELYAVLHAQNKLVIQAVPARTSAKDWNQEFNYSELIKSVDYLHIMTYDYSMSKPGAIAPLGWIEKVLQFAQSQKLEMSKVLIGIPYYGRDWKLKPGESTYSKSSVGLYSARELINTYKPEVKRETSAEDPVGTPYFSYTDAEKNVHVVYYDDPLSWEAKLSLMDRYGVGGVGAWSLFWMTEETAKEIFPVVQRHVR